jgi:hypothetical protein
LIEVTDTGLRQTVSPFSRWTPVEVLVILNTVAVIITVPVQYYYVIDETAKKYGQSHITRQYLVPLILNESLRNLFKGFKSENSN